MTLRGDIIAMIAPGGVKVSRVYWQFRDLDRSRIDAALHSLCADRSLVRVSGRLYRPARQLHLRCMRCHEPRRMDEVLDHGVCIRCASDEIEGVGVVVKHRTCNEIDPDDAVALGTVLAVVMIVAVIAVLSFVAGRML